jgi:hypothetical protein
MIRSKLSPTYLTGLIVWPSLLSISAYAGCWEERALVERADQVMRHHFPRIVRLPTVLACSASDFPPAVGGTFNSFPTPTIRIPVWQLGQPEIDVVLGHELGHFQAFLDGTDDGSAGGHGKGWMIAMLAAGLHSEAERVAAVVPGAARALAQARGPERPPAPARPAPTIEDLPPQYIEPQRHTCFLEPCSQVWIDRRGRRYVSTFFVEVCRVW